MVLRTLLYLSIFISLIGVIFLFGKTYTSPEIKKDFEDGLQNSILDYYSNNILLQKRTEEIINQMSDKELAGMLIQPAWEKAISKKDLKKWICEYHINGFMILRKDIDVADIKELKKYYKENCPIAELPLFVSIDAEPSLIKWRLPQLYGVANTDTLQTKLLVNNAAERIHVYLKKLGVNINFAPVVDSDKNKAIIGNRSFGFDARHIKILANVFMDNAITHTIIPTIKHFPGHGNVTGDTHKNLQTINGELLELENFKPLLSWKAPLVMVGHLAVANNTHYNTDGLPATLSKKIIQNALRNELGFTGVVITDAMGMGAVADIKDAPMRAIEAGVDIVLMPPNIKKTYKNILNKIQKDKNFKQKIKESVKRIVKLKLTLLWSQQ